jgi:hypothetical protein
MRTTILEQLRGIGTVTIKGQNAGQVRYWLDVDQEWMPVASFDDPEGEVAGLKTLTGRVDSIGGGFMPPVGDVFTLKLEDGRKTDLFVQNSDGTIACSKGLY